MIRIIHTQYQPYMPNVLDKNTRGWYNEKQERLVLRLSQCLQKHTTSPFASPYKNGIYFQVSQGNRWVACQRYSSIFLSPDGDNSQGKQTLNTSGDSHFSKLLLGILDLQYNLLTERSISSTHYD